MASEKQEVYKIDINAFSRGMDSDTKDQILPKDNYRYAENVRVDDGVLVSIDGSTKSYNIETSSGVNDITVLGTTLSRALVKSEGKTIDVIVLFYLESFILGEMITQNPRLKCKIIPLNQSYGIYQMFDEEIDISLEEDYKATTIDLDKIGQSGYDTVYFVDNIRPPRKIELIIESVDIDYVNVSLGSITKRPDIDIYDVVINVNVVDGENSNTIIGAKNNFTAYVRSYREGLLPSHPSANASTTRLKSVNFTVGQTTKTAIFTVYPQDLDSWVFNLFYYKDGAVTYSDFVIGDPESVKVSVGVLPDSQKFLARSAQDGSGADDDLTSWDFITNGPIFSYFIDTPSLVLNTTKIYKTNLESDSNYVEDGYHQAWNNSLQNYYFKVESGVITEFAINSAPVYVYSEPAGYQGSIDALYTTTTFNRLSTVSIDVPASISGDSFKRALVGDSLTILNNEISYQLTTRDQTEIEAVYQDLVILKMQTIGSEQENSSTSNLIKKTVRYSVESPSGASVKFNITASANASRDDVNESAAAFVQIGAAGIFLSAVSGAGDPASYTAPAEFTVLPGSYMDVYVEIETRITQDSQTATAQAEVEFDVVTMIGAGVPTKIRVDGTLLDYNIVILNQLING